ncbi:MAG: glycosyltransferase family 4 protein [Oscillochloris sp.]|nr:glycosyltransferase family 4 protein [Oscillochloris sp.]
MRIGIDVRYLSHGLVGGVHTYVAHFVPALIAAAAEHEIILYADTKRPFELADLPERVKLRLLPYRGPHSSVLNDLLMRRAMAADRIDVGHFPANYGFAPRQARSVITLHDAINLMPLTEIIRGHGKDLRTVAMMSYLHLMSTAALRRADLVVTVSAHAAREIARYSGYDPARIVAVHHAPTPDLRRITDPATLDAVRARYQLPARFVLADGLKNPAVLIRAWPHLPETMRRDTRLVFFARREPLPIVREAEAAGIALLLINPPRQDLVALYSMADAFAFPSWIEGFGIPILEAMTCGAAVIASDRGSIPEVAGTAALIADAEDERAFAAHLTQVLGNSHTAAALRERGYARAAQFSWQRTAQAILTSYECVVQDRRLQVLESEL